MAQVNTIAVVGAGTIGNGLAVDLARFGYNVILNDISDEELQKAAQTIRTDLRTYRMLVPEYREIDDEDVLSRITYTSDPAAMAAADFVIENIVEDYNEKVRLYERLSEICRKDTFYAVNTSCISITKLANHIEDPTRMIGMHFMNPVPVKKFVEMIRAEHTSEETIEAALALLKRLGNGVEPLLLKIENQVNPLYSF